MFIFIGYFCENIHQASLASTSVTGPSARATTDSLSFSSASICYSTGFCGSWCFGSVSGFCDGVFGGIEGYESGLGGEP